MSDHNGLVQGGARCLFCGGENTRRKGSRYCSPGCKQAYKDSRFASPGQVECLPGSYLLALQAPNGLVQVSHTYRLRQRIRLAQTGSAELLTVIAIVPADDTRAARFRAAHQCDRVRSSWYRPSARLLDYLSKRTLPVLPTITVAAAAQVGAAKLSSEAAS